jgi:hypothetical protein
VKAEKTTITKVKHKSNQPQLSKENFKKPPTFLGIYMLESVQVFHALGKRSDKNIGPSSGQETQAAPKAPSFLQLSNHGWIPHKRAKVLKKKKNSRQTQTQDSSAGNECTSASQHELPPPGKVMLVRLSFPAEEKPQTRPGLLPHIG